MKTEWSTVSLVKEAPDIIKRFVSYHLSVGASRMVLFFDDPKDPCVEMLAHLDRVTAIRCDDSFWRSIGQQPEMRHGRRQNLSTLHGYKSIPDGWVVNLDADEFLYVADRSPAALIAEFPENTPVIRLLPAEQVYLHSDPQKLAFRLTVDKHTLRRIHGDIASLFARKSGFVGHVEGKSIIRAGQKDIRLRPHWTVDAHSQVIQGAVRGASVDAALLHMNAYSFDDWRSKLAFRLGTKSLPGKLRVHLQECFDKQDEECLKATYDSVQYFNAAQEAEFTKIARLMTPELNIAQAVAHYFPE